MVVPMWASVEAFRSYFFPFDALALLCGEAAAAAADVPTALSAAAFALIAFCLSRISICFASAARASAATRRASPTSLT